MQIEKIKKSYLRLLLLFCLYLFFITPNSPLFLDLGFDREIFQYIGFIIRENLVPYTDVFDHKPPLIYIINYVGFLITPNSTWGVFIIINIIGLFSSYLVFQFAYSKFSNFYYSLFTFIIYLSLCNVNNILEGGNLTRQITLFLSIILLYTIFSKKKTKKYLIISGSLLGLIFFTQQNEILSPSVIVIYYIFFNKSFKLESFKKITENLIFFSIGFLIITSMILLLVLYWNNLNDFLNQAFLYNINSHINDTVFYKKFINSFRKLITLSYSNRILLLLVLLIIFNIFSIYTSKKVSHNKKLISVLIVAFFIQILSTSLSGNVFHHYFLMFIPIVIYLFIYTVNKTAKMFNTIVFACLMITVIFNTKNMNFSLQNNSLFKEVIKNVSSEKNSIGQFYSFNAKFLRVNYKLNIISPSKWVYTNNNNIELQSKELLSDFKKHKTKYILFNQHKSTPSYELINYIKSNYKVVFTKDKYILYIKKEIQ